MTQPVVPNNQPCPHCGRWHNRATTVDGVVEWESKIVLVKRNEDPYKNCWALPGGYPDDNETLPNATIREVFEETKLLCHNPAHRRF